MMLSLRSVPSRYLGLFAATGLLWACNPDSMSATFNDVVVPMTNYSATGTQNASGTYQIAVGGSYGSMPGCQDCGAGLTLTLEFDTVALLALPRNEPVPIDGATHFALSTGHYTYDLPDSDIHFTPGATNHPALQRAWLRYGCFCTRYFAEDQTLLGTLTLTSPVGAAALSGTVDVTTDGAVPFYQGGLAPPQQGIVHATFTVTPPPSH